MAGKSADRICTIVTTNRLFGGWLEGIEGLGRMLSGGAIAGCCGEAQAIDDNVGFSRQLLIVDDIICMWIFECAGFFICVWQPDGCHRPDTPVIPVAHTATQL